MSVLIVKFPDIMKEHSGAGWVTQEHSHMTRLRKAAGDGELCLPRRGINKKVGAYYLTVVLSCKPHKALIVIHERSQMSVERLEVSVYRVAFIDSVYKLVQDEPVFFGQAAACHII